jgi:DNA-binding MarR family transcriptional regulator
MSEPIYDVKTFEPWNAVGYLIGHTRRAMLEELDRELAPLDLTAAQYIVISALSRAGNGATAAEFCKKMVYDPGAMTRLLDRLEQKGFVQRTRLPGDRRRVTLELTAEGAAAFPKMTAAVVRVLNHFLRDFDKNEVRQLEGFLRRMMANGASETEELVGSEHG